MNREDSYQARLCRIIAFIEANLDQALTLEVLCDVAAFSKYHFQRQFSAAMGISPHRYVQLCRLKRAASQLVFRRETPVMEIALIAGYESPEAFYRAFRKVTGLSPSEFRENPDWTFRDTASRPLLELRSSMVQNRAGESQVSIVDFPETKVALLEHRGSPKNIGETLRKFIEWRKENRLPPKISATFNLVYDDPQKVAWEDYRFAVCAATDRDVAENDFGVVAEKIPAGRCAKLCHIGSDDGLGEVIRNLYSEWLPQSGEELRDFPIYLQRVKFFPDVPEHEAVTDVFLPLK